MKFSMECSLCEKQLRFPVSTTTCRHNFCSQCVFVYLKTVTQDEIACPKCSRPLKKDDFREDKSLNEVFRNLEKTRQLQSNELSSEKMHLILEYYQLDKDVINKIGAPSSDVLDLYLPRSTKIEVLRSELNKKLRFKRKKLDPFYVMIMNHKQNKEYSPQTTLGIVAFEYGKFDNLRIYFTISLNIPNKVSMPRMGVKAKLPCLPSSSTSSLSVAPPKIINELQTTNKKVAMSSPLAERSITMSPTTSTNIRRSDGPLLIKPRPPAPPRIISPRSSTAESTSKENEKKNERPPIPPEATVTANQTIPATNQQQRPTSPNKIFDTASIDNTMCRFVTHIHLYEEGIMFEPSLIEAVMRMPPLLIDGQSCVFYITPFGLLLMREPEDKQTNRSAEYIMNPLQYTLEERPPKTTTPGTARFVQVKRIAWTKDPRWMRIFTLDLAFLGANQELANLPLTSAHQEKPTQKLSSYKVTIINPYEWPKVIQTIHPMSLKQHGLPLTQSTQQENAKNGSQASQALSINVNTAKPQATVASTSTINATNNVNVTPLPSESKVEPAPAANSAQSAVVVPPFGRVHKSKSLTPPPMTNTLTIAKPPMLITAPTTSSNADWSEETKPPALISMAVEEPEKPAAIGVLTFKKLIEQRKQELEQESKLSGGAEMEERKRKLSVSIDKETKPEGLPTKKTNVGTPPPSLQPMVTAPNNLIPTTVPPGATVHFVMPSTSNSHPSIAPPNILPYPAYPVSSVPPDVTSAMIQNIGAQFKQNPQMAPVTILPSNATMAPNYGYINTPNGPTPAIIGTTSSGKPTFLLPNGMQLVHCSNMPSNFIRMEPPAGFQSGAHFPPGMPPGAQAMFARAQMVNNNLMGGQCSSQMPRMKSPPMMVTPQIQMQQPTFNVEGEFVQKDRLKRLEEMRMNEVKRKESSKEREAAMKAMAVLKAENNNMQHLNNKTLSIDTKTTHTVISSLTSTASKPSPSMAAMPVLCSMSPTAGATVDAGAVNSSAQMPHLTEETDDGPPMLEAMDMGPPTKKMKPSEEEGMQGETTPRQTVVPNQEKLKPASALAEALSKSQTTRPPTSITIPAQGTFTLGQTPNNSSRAERTTQKDLANFNPYGEDMQKMRDLLRSPEFAKSNMKHIFGNQVNFGLSQDNMIMLQQSAQQRRSAFMAEQPRPPMEKNQPPSIKKMTTPSNSMSCFTSLRPPIASISPQPEEKPLNIRAVEMTPNRIGVASTSTILPTAANISEFKITEASVCDVKRPLDIVYPTPPPSTSAESMDFRALASMKGQTLGKTLKETLFGKRKSTDGPRPSVSPSKPMDPSQALPTIQPSLTASQ